MNISQLSNNVDRYVYSSGSFALIDLIRFNIAKNKHNDLMVFIRE